MSVRRDELPLYGGVAGAAWLAVFGYSLVRSTWPGSWVLSTPMPANDNWLSPGEWPLG